MSERKVNRFRVALYGILVRDGRVLMTETKVPKGAILNFPGGGLELGESPIQAIEREFDEETGLVVKVEQLLYATERFFQNDSYPDEQLIHLYYRVSATGGTMREGGNNDDVLALHWFTRESIPSERTEIYDRDFLGHGSFAGLF